MAYLIFGSFEILTKNYFIRLVVIPETQNLLQVLNGQPFIVLCMIILEKNVIMGCG